MSAYFINRGESRNRKKKGTRLYKHIYIYIFDSKKCGNISVRNASKVYKEFLRLVILFLVYGKITCELFSRCMCYSRIRQWVEFLVYEKHFTSNLSFRSRNFSSRRNSYINRKFALDTGPDLEAAALSGCNCPTGGGTLKEGVSLNIFIDHVKSWR